MPIMKAQQSRRTIDSAIVMDLSDLERQAAEIVGNARQEAARLMTDGRAAAQRESMQLREAARQTGHAEGREAGLAEGRQQGHDEALAAVTRQLNELTARWSQALELFQQNMPSHIADARTDVVRLALAVAARVTRQEGLRNRNVAPAVAEEALRMLAAARRVKLLAHPADVQMLQKYLTDMRAKMNTIEDIELSADDTVGAGGCVLRFGEGEIDARLETQVMRISDELLGAEAPPTDAPPTDRQM